MDDDAPIEDLKLLKKLRDYKSDGLITENHVNGLSVFNYSNRAVYASNWDSAIKQARGLVFDTETGRVVARPFAKFFNLNEREDTRIESLPGDGICYVCEKYDGSLGIIFYHDGEWKVSTRGKLGSVQATRAKEILYRYNTSHLEKEFTYLVEIIYPENRIVIDYGDAEKLVLLTMIRTSDGKEFFTRAKDAARRVGFDLSNRKMIQSKDLDISSLNSANGEGYVLYWPDYCDLRVKLKTESYVMAHRMLDTFRTDKSVYEIIDKGIVDDVISKIPDHLKGEFKERLERCVGAINELVDQAIEAFKKREGLFSTKKEFALSLEHIDEPVRSMVFMLYNRKRKDIDKVAIRHLKRECR